MSIVGHLARARTFTSLRRHRNYRLWFAGQVVSVSGTWMQNVGQAWLVLQLTGSPSAVGLLAAFQFGPYALLGLLGGVIADRFDRRRTLVVTQSLPIVFASALAALTLSHHVAVWQVDAVAVLNGLVLVADTPARQAFTVEMVGRRELPNAVALNSSVFNASRIIGPAIGGLVIAGVGVGLCFALNALSYLAVLAGILLMRVDELHTVARDEQSANVLRQMREGLGYAWRQPVVRMVLLMMLFVGTISINFNVLLPVLSATTLHQSAVVYGLLSASFGAGALCGALLAASLGRADLRVLLLGCAGLASAELVLAGVGSVVVAALLLVAGGLAFTLYTANSNSLIQLSVPDHLRGRVISLYAYVFFGTAPVGGYLAGRLSEHGTGPAFLLGGAVALAAAVAGAAWWWRSSAAPQPPKRRRRPAPSDAEIVRAT